MNVLGLLIHNDKCWGPLVDAGAIPAAVVMLRRPDASQQGAARALGMLYLLAMIKTQSVKTEPGALDVLHTYAQGRGGAENAKVARKAIEYIAEKNHTQTMKAVEAGAVEVE